MDSGTVIEQVESSYDGVVVGESWGERAVFYNPGRQLARGAYFLTVKEGDGKNDDASELDRDEVFRVSIGVSYETYESLFGERPERPSKGGVVDLDHDFAERDVVLPHPVYAWMGWVCVLSPTEETFSRMRSLVDDAYDRAVARFDDRVGTTD